MFKVKNITKVYKSKEGITVNALTDISIDFGDKGLVFLLGKSGSGKSTLLNLLGGLDAPTSGEIIINRRSSATFSGADFDNYRNTYVGIVFQEYNLIENYTAGVNIGLALELQGKKADKEQIDAILRKVGLADSRGVTLYNRRVNELSGGQKQRVAIARALIKKPEIILADEPTGALDNKTGESLYELFKELSKEKLVIVVTHDKESAEKYGDRIIELADGEIVSDDERVVRKDIDNGEKDCNFIKSRLSLKRSVALGISALKVKPMRLIATILLSVMALSIFGFSMVAQLTDIYTSEIQTMYAHNQCMVGITNYQNYDAIVKYNNDIEPIIIYSESNYEEFDEYYEDSSSNYLQFNNNTWYAELDPVTGEKDANLSPDSRFINKDLCRLPQTANEVAITDYYADKFIQLGYNQNGRKIEIFTPDDLIGKKFGGLTICGVYSTEIDLSDYREYDASFNSSDAYVQNMISGISTSMLSYRFVCKGYGKSENSSLSGVLLKLSGDIDKDRALIKDISCSNKPLLHSAYSNSVRFLKNFDAYIKTPLAFALILFAIISFLLMFNFVSVSITSKKQQLGVLRALGATKGEILLICTLESAIVSMLIFIFSLLVLLFTCGIINILNGIALFNIRILHVLFVFLICVTTTIMATIIPVILIVRKKPIEIIKR